MQSLRAETLRAGSDDVSHCAVPTGEALLPHNDDFRLKFNRLDFMFDHGLGHHPMFELTALLELANRIPKHTDFVYWQNGRVKINDKWGANPAKRLTLEETVRGIEENESLVILKHAEQDPVYGPLLQEILQRIYSFTAPSVQADIVLGESLIFLNSPKRKTAYHLDLESNFLLQIRGEKLIHVFDSGDRTLTTHLELENHCGGDANGAIYKPDRECEAHLHRLTAGHGVHFPSMGPHWVENGDAVSVSININFDLVSIHHRLKRIYRVNRMMRRLGISPSAPGESKVVDAIKENLSVTAGAVSTKWLDVTGGRDESETYPAWRPAREGNPASGASKSH